MGTVGAGFSMSLDGFIAGPGDDVERLFTWYFSGDTPLDMSTGHGDLGFRPAAESAEVFAEAAAGIGAIVSGRRMFDVAGGWGGKHPMEVPVFVVTHSVPQEWVYEGSPFTFVTDGVESAVAQARQAAGDKNVGVGGAAVTRSCIDAGLLDEVHIDLVPVLLGEGIRLFDHLSTAPVELERTAARQGRDVTHLTFRIVK